MPIRGWLADLALIRAALSVGTQFGEHSLVELARLGLFVEHAVYVPHSLVAVRGGLRFVLRNPPLRLGAFDSVRLAVNGDPIPPESVLARKVGDARPRRLSEVDRSAPLELLPGETVEFQTELVPRPPTGSEVTVRLDLHNVAIPPNVWFQFRDRVGEGAP